MVGAIKAGVKKGVQVFDNSAAGAAADAAEQQNLGRKFGQKIWAENLGRIFGQKIWAENLTTSASLYIPTYCPSTVL